MPYNSIIDRSDAGALIPEEVSAEIIQALPASSVTLAAFRQVRMSRAQQRMPVLSALPTAYWVNGDTGLKQTADVNWTNKFLNAEELAVLVPISESVLEDTEFDVWGEVRPRVVEAIGSALDAAVFFGTNKPASWPDAIVTAAIAAGNNYDSGSVAGKDIADEINTVMGLVEVDGFPVNGHTAASVLKASLRGLRGSDGQFILQAPSQGGAPATVFGEPIRYMDNGGWDAAAARLVTGDFRQGILGVRKDITYKVLDQAVIQDGNGAIVYNLAQQDMVALRVVARFAFQVPNPVNRLNASANRYPFAVLQP